MYDRDKGANKNSLGDEIGFQSVGVDIHIT